MKIDKEYPATHSMNTAWYFVDEDDNVAIFSFEECGPKPDTVDEDQWINELCFEMPVVKKDGIKHLNLTDEQVEHLVSNLWQATIPSDYYWGDDLFKIDTDKTDLFLSYLQECQDKYGSREEWDYTFIPLCLSKKMGIYVVDFNAFRYGKGLQNEYVKYLWENKIITKYSKVPDFDFDDSEELKGHCPYILYRGDCDPAIPHKRTSVPISPVKITQLPIDIQGKAVKLKLRFMDCPQIQIATHWLCYSSESFYDSVRINDAWYFLVFLPNNEKVYVLNNEKGIDTSLPLFLTEAEIEKYKSKNDD